MSDAPERVTCPHCGKAFRWQAKLIERHVPCKACDGTFIVPYEPGEGIPVPAEPKEGYELDLDEPKEQTTGTALTNDGKCPICNAPVRAGAVICMNCGYNLVEGKKVETAVAATPAAGDAIDKPDKATRRQERDLETAAETHRQYLWQEYRLPIILLCIGLAFVLINTFGLTPAVNDMLTQKGYAILTNQQAMIGYIVAFAFTLVMMLPLLLGGIFFMASFLGSAFGNLFTALLKLLALTVFVVGLDDMVDLLLNLMTGGHGGIGWMVRFGIVMAAFYPICIKLFDMESYEIAIMFLLYVIGPIAIGMLAMMIAMSFL